jgi:PAS domain S-box-containing protein
MKGFSNFSLLLIENIPNPVIVFNSEGKLIYANEKGDKFIKDFFGEDKEELKKFFISVYRGDEFQKLEEIKSIYNAHIIELLNNTKAIFIEKKSEIFYHENLIDFFSEISQIQDINLILQKFSQFLLNLTKAGKVTIFLYDEKLKVYKRVALITRPPFKEEEFKKNIFRIGEGITGKVIETGVVFYAPDVDKVKEYYRSSQAEKSELIIPIKDKEMVYGTIGIGSEKEDAFKNLDIRFLEKISNFLLLIIKNLHLYQDIIRREKEINLCYSLPESEGEEISLENYVEKILNLFIKIYDFEGIGLNYENFNFWKGKGKEEFEKVLKGSPENIISAHFSLNNFYFYIIPFKTKKGFIVFVTTGVLSEKEIKSFEYEVEFIEKILSINLRRELSFIYKKLTNILIDSFIQETDIKIVYKNVCEALSKIFNSEKVLIMEEKGGKLSLIYHFPQEEEIFSIEEIQIKEEKISKEYASLIIKEKPLRILYVINPKNVERIYIVKDFLKPYFEFIFKIEKYNKNRILIHIFKKLIEKEIEVSSLKEYLDEVCNIIRENFGYSFVGILLKENDYLKLISSSGYEKYRDLSIKIGEEGLSGIAFKNEETIYSPDVTKSPYYIKVSDLIKSEVAIPLKTEREKIGVIVISSPRFYDFSEEDIAFLENLASQISIFIENIFNKEEREEMLSFLEEEVKFSEMVLRNIPVGIVVTDTDLNIKRVNEGFNLLLKKEAKELIGRKICDFICSHPKGGFCKIENSFINRTPLFREKFMVDIKGETIPLAITSSFVYGPSDVINGIILIVEDIREVAKLEEQLRRTERLSAMGKIAAYMAHEIKNPLASISTGIEFISEKLPKDENIKIYMDMILKEIYRLDRLIKNLLSFASRRPVRKIPVNIVNLLKESIVFITPEIVGKEIKILQNFEDEELVVHLDPDQFKEVILNLLRNSIEAIEKEGEIEIGVKRFGNNALLWCKDNGKGIKEEYIHSIFEPFFSTKKGGSGLGLAIVHKIVEEHGGKIEVESEYGKGTIFRIYLPL